MILLSICTIFAIRYEKKKAKLSYHINLIDELHANENAHTRILLKLLQFNFRDHYSILRSFFDIVEQKMNGKFEIGEIHRPQVRFNQENIDGEESEKYGVIIENKIHWAVDQDKPIDRYVEITKNFRIMLGEILV